MLTHINLSTNCLFLAYSLCLTVHSSRKEEPTIMQHIITPRTLWRMAAVRPSLVGISLPAEPPGAFCCCDLRTPPSPQSVGCHWLSTSASSRVPSQPKHQAPPEKPQGRDDAGAAPAEVDPLHDKSTGLVQRFKKTFKQYGKVMIPVHLVTSSVWFGSFYYAAMKWVNFNSEFIALHLTVCYVFF